MTAPARVAAYDALHAIVSGSVDLPAALAVSRRRLRDDRDRALTAEIVTGTLRWQRALDALAESLSSRPIATIEPEVLVVLRLSLYQLRHLDRVPAAAVVNDAVDLVRRARRSAAAGFVNAVLRAFVRGGRRAGVPERPADSSDRASAIAYLGVSGSHPDWLVGRWLDRWGFAAAERWVAFDNATPQLTVRANTLVTTRAALAEHLLSQDVATTPSRIAPDGLMVVSGNPLRAPAQGRFVVQDEASQLVTLAVGARPGERILDLCASPGGKATAMAAAMRDSGRLVACDVRPRRLALLDQVVRASRASCISIVRVAPHGGLPFNDGFDRVLVDAPCSGLGTIRRDPDIRWRRREGDLPVLAAAQGELLRRAAAAVRPGGRLVYATCSSEPEENEQVIERFLAARPDFQIANLRGENPQLDLVLNEDGALQTLPFRHDLEAFYAAALQRAS